MVVATTPPMMDGVGVVEEAGAVYGVCTTTVGICSSGGDERDCRVGCFYELRGYCLLACGSSSSALLGSTYMHKYAGSCTEAAVYRALYLALSPGRVTSSMQHVGVGSITASYQCYMLQDGQAVENKHSTWLLPFFKL